MWLSEYRAGVLRRRHTSHEHILFDRTSPSLTFTFSHVKWRLKGQYAEGETPDLAYNQVLPRPGLSWNAGILPAEFNACQQDAGVPAASFAIMSFEIRSCNEITFTFAGNYSGFCQGTIDERIAIRKERVTQEKGGRVPALRGVAADHRILRRSSLTYLDMLIRLSLSAVAWRSRQIVKVILLQLLSGDI
jgi:hypothetical protein